MLPNCYALFLLLSIWRKVDNQEIFAPGRGIYYKSRNVSIYLISNLRLKL